MKDYKTPFLSAVAMLSLLGTISSTLAAEVSDKDYYDTIDEQQQVGTTTPNTVQPNSIRNDPNASSVEYDNSAHVGGAINSTSQADPHAGGAMGTSSDTSVSNNGEESITPLLDESQERSSMNATDGRVPNEPNNEGSPMVGGSEESDDAGAMANTAPASGNTNAGNNNTNNAAAPNTTPAPSSNYSGAFGNSGQAQQGGAFGQAR